MTTTDTAVDRDPISESLPELAAGIAVIILTILGLAGVSPPFLVAIAVIVFGVALVLGGRAAVAELHRVLARHTTIGGAVGVTNGWSMVFLAGIAGIVLGILALLGVASAQLVAIAVIAFGAALLISANATLRVRVLAGTMGAANPTVDRLVQEAASDNAGLQTMVGLAAIVLGILALSGFAPTTLVLIALLGLGCFAGLSSSFLAGSLARLFQSGS